MIQISEGNSGNYLVQGVFSVVFSILLFVASGFFGVLLFIIGLLVLTLAILLFTASNGLELDPESNRYRTYGKIGNYKFGSWSSFSSPSKVYLAMHADNEYRETAPMMGRAAALSTKVITYDIRLEIKSGEEVVLYDFLDYKKAKSALKFIGESYDIPTRNLIAEKMAENRQKRSRR